MSEEKINDSGSGSEQKLVTIHEVMLFSQEQMGYMVVLKENADSKEFFQMFIGEPEFMAIAKEKGLLETPRPLSHDLYLGLIKESALEILRVEIYALQERTYLARVVYRTGGEEKARDARPSDCVALSLHIKVPILVNRSLLQTADQPAVKQDILRDFIKSVEF